MVITNQEPLIVSYIEYYIRVIEMLQQKENLTGLKLVVGPTGLGKTQAIPAVIEEIRAKNIEQRCIYTSNRHLLIEEMHELLSGHKESIPCLKAPIPCVYLKSDETVVKQFIKQKDSDRFLRRLEEQKFFEQYANVSLKKVATIVKNLRHALQGLEHFLSKEFRDAYNELQHQITNQCGEFLKIFKDGLRKVAKDQPELHAQLCQEQHIGELFPYIRFLYDPQRPVLLVTIHKLLSGFFDGKKTEKILALENNIIFFDEFDMQEKEILKFLCKSPEIRNSFEFVRLFYEEMQEQQALGYLTLIEGDSEKRNKAKAKVGEILNTLQSRFTEHLSITPQFKRFVVREGDFKSDDIAVFQSSIQVLTNPFYLLDQLVAWQVVRERTAHVLESRRLFQIIFDTAETILNLFSELWVDELPEWDNWIEQCYNKKNDYAAGEYKRLISDYGIYKRPTKILSGRGIPEEVKQSIYYKGYNFFRLKKGVYRTAPNEVKIEQHKLTVSPEYILWRLCRSNLIFALSATGDIRRYINAFDLNWLEKQCQYIPIDDWDRTFVAGLKQRKEQQRNYDVQVAIAQEISRRHPLNRAIEDLHKDYRFFKKETEETSGNKQGEYRKNTVKRFLETLRWITTESNNQGHLVFLNSFHFIEKLFRQEPSIHRSFYDNIRQQLAIEKLTEREREYCIRIDGKACHVVFFDAAKSKSAKDKEDFMPYREDLPLVVVTTYNTASNGVNLKWVKSTHDERRDFEGIHLLDLHYYYFDPLQQESTDGIDRRKKFLWQIWKLFFQGSEISELQFTSALRDLNINRMNMQYKTRPDYLLNQISLLYQALGRVDRQWQKMPKMDIRLSADVIEIFQRYLTAEGNIAKERFEREPYTSSLILKLHEELTRQYIKTKVLNELTYEDLCPLQERCQAKIAALLKMSEKVRQGSYSETDSRKVIHLWWKIRDAMLKQDYQFHAEMTISETQNGTPQTFDIDFQRDFVHRTAFLQNETEIYFNRQQQTIHPHKLPETSPLNLNWAYRGFERNHTIKWYFNGYNYKLGYHPSNQHYLFTPHALQAILAGAVGEIALKAILENHCLLDLEREQEMSACLFEVADSKLKDAPIYFDAKNYGWSTLSRFAAKPDDPEFDEKFNPQSFLSAAQRKWRYIVEKTGDLNAKLVFVNLVADDYRLNEGWDANLKKIEPYSLKQSAITIIQGALDAQTYAVRDEFATWINELKELIFN